MDIADLLRRAARQFPGSPAIDDGSRSLSLRSLVARGERLANAFDALGVPEGASVGILSENRTGYLEADVAIALGRRVRVALNARLHLEDHRYVAGDSSMRVLLHSTGFADVAAALREEFGLTTISFDEDDPSSPWYETLIERADGVIPSRGTDPEAPAWLTYTSGTTGTPKGVVLSHRSICAVAFNLLIELGPAQPGEQLILTQALSHGAGYFTLPYLLSGAGLYVQGSFDSEQVWELSRRDNIRTVKLVPAMLAPLLDAASGNWGCETAVYGASPVPRPVLDRSLDRFGPSLIQIYGQTEAPVTITCLHKDDHLIDEARLSAGRPWRSVAVEVIDAGRPVAPGDIGEIFVRGPHLMSGYLNRPTETAQIVADGWIRTKDMARVDDRGFVYLQGRSDEMINSGGQNIAPREVEDVLATHHGVDEVVVLGVPDERWGSAVTAVVRALPVAGVTPQELIEFARPRLGIRAPKRVILREDIPRTPYGKVDRIALRALVDEATSGS